MTAFDEVTADLAVLAALPDVPAVVDFLFPAGQNSTLQIRTTATGMLAANPAVDLQTLVSELVTAITQPEIPSDVQEVRIMSLHKSKGLSSPVTIVAGCVNGLLPRPVKSPVTPAERLAHDEEQRRLFYVGITRVKSDPANGKPGTLILTYSQQMPMADAMRAGISPAYSSYGIAVLQASPYIAEMAPAAPAAIAG